MKINEKNIIRNLAILAVAAGVSFATVSCEKSAVDEKADGVRESAEETADIMEDKADLNRQSAETKADSTEDAADAVRNAAEKKADAIEDGAKANQ